MFIRKDHVSFPATKDRAAFSHDDLLITSNEPGRQSFHAEYWDNEGHAIHYTGEAHGASAVRQEFEPGGPASPLCGYALFRLARQKELTPNQRNIAAKQAARTVLYIGAVPSLFL